MADEKNTFTDQDTGEDVAVTPEYEEGEADLLPEAETVVDEVVEDILEASEEATDTALVQGFDTAVSAVQDAVDALDNDQSKTAHLDPHLSDTVVIMGRSITVPGGIYTVVFGALAVATVIEIALAELPRGFFTIPIMVSLALVKAVLVVAYYMHLREDSRIFTLTLLIPLLIALTATLFLLAVPVNGY